MTSIASSRPSPRDPLALTPEYRNALLTAYWPILKRICRRVWWQSTRRDFVEIEDIEQEGVLVFCGLLEQWSGEGSFTRFLLGRFRWRVRDRARLLAGRPMTDQLARTLVDSATDSYEAEMALALLQELVEPLNPFDRALVTARVLDGRSFAAIGVLLGMSTASIENRWRILRVDLYRNLQLLLNNIE